MYSLLDRFLEYSESNRLFNSQSRVLLAVSGGIDSMVMTDLFLDASISVAIAHCNFRLRGKESDEDEQFLRTFSENKGLDFYTTSFETSVYAQEKKLSIQMAARELRYTFFEETRKRFQYGIIATAHNRDDRAETFFINLVRGSGISGLKGIPVKTGNLVRPLLFASREEIATYAREQGVPYREDSSNKTTKYLRNKIRHDIIPQLESLNPDFRNNLDESIQYLKGAADVYYDQVEQAKSQILRQEEGLTIIDTGLLDSLPHGRTILSEILREYRFTPAVVREIMLALQGLPGKQFYSPQCRLVTNRNELIITEVSKSPEELFYLEAETSRLEYPITLHISNETRKGDYHIIHDPRIASLDLDCISFPLCLRKWRAGDYFFPLGMKSMKKLSDFFIDNKLSIPEKENTWLLLSGDQIVWVAGYRIDDRFKITNKTRKVLKIEMIK